MTDQRDTPDTRTPSAEGRGHVEHHFYEIGANLAARFAGSVFPAPAPTEGGTSDARSRRASDQSPMLSTADRDALVDALRIHGVLNAPGVAQLAEAVFAQRMEDLTRENERLRVEVETWRTQMEEWQPTTDALRAQVAAQRAIALEQDPERLWLPPGNCEAAYSEGQGCSLADRFAVLDGATPGATE